MTPEIARIEIAGESIELLPDRAAWWPGRRTLIVADLHLGKERAFGAVGIAIPGGGLDETLTRLAKCVETLHAERIIITGDLLHAKPGTTPTIIERVAAWRRECPVEIWLVPGNHDRESERVAEPWRLRLCPDEVTEGPFRFVHKPDAGRPDTFTWCGHLHPVVRLEAGIDVLRLPCFHIAERLGILPAFSLFTGGSRTEISPGHAVWAIGPGRVFKTPPPRQPAAGSTRSG